MKEVKNYNKKSDTKEIKIINEGGEKNKKKANFRTYLSSNWAWS